MFRMVSGALVALALGSALPALGADVDWTRIYRDDVPFVDGMLWPDRIIVHFDPAAVPRVGLGKDGEVVTDQLALDQLNRRFGVRGLGRLFPEVADALKADQPPGLDLLYTVDFEASHGLKAVADAYLRLPGVTRVEPVAVHSYHAVVPNDPDLGQQVWLRSATVGGKDIRAIGAWYHQLGDPNVIVAVADSGVDWQHPDLGGTGPDYTDGSIWFNTTELNGINGLDDDGNGRVDDVRGWDFVTGVTGEQNPPQDVNTQDNNPFDYEGHGTQVAGCAAAITDNGIGGAGASFGCSVMALRIGWLPAGSQQGVIRTDFAAQALNYARVKGADVFNASWGNSDSGGFGTATQNAINNGMVIVCAAGNDDSSDAQFISYLSARNDVLSVAAVDNNDIKAGFSNFGNTVEISAPGVGIYTTSYNRGTGSHTYAGVNGTSFASPIVAGVAAFAISAFPADTGAQIRARLIAAVDDIAALNPGFGNFLGSGRINMTKLFNNPKWLLPDQFDTWVDALNSAEADDELAIRGGETIQGRLILPGSSKPLQINGGYDATFSTRDPVNNKSIMQGEGGLASVILSNQGTDAQTVVDGFEITGGNAPSATSQPQNGNFGGGIIVRAGDSPTFSNLLVHGNNAGNGSQNGGGGGIAVLGGSPTFTDVEVTNNSAPKGQGIYVYRGSPVFNNVNVHDNVGQNPVGVTVHGGGVYVFDTAGANGSVTFNGGTISGHTVLGSGGGIYTEASDLALDGVTVDDNESSDVGGGICVEGGTYTGTNNIVTNNRVTVGTNKSGGGLHVTGGATADIDAGWYEGNFSAFAGGGISLDGCVSPSVTNTFAVGNMAATLGSGVYLRNCTGSTIQSNTIAHNSGALAGGNGLYLENGDATVATNLIAGNGSAGAIADGVQCAGAAATFSCNLVWNNNAGNYGGCPDPTGTNGNAEAFPNFCDSPPYDIAFSSAAAAAHSGGCGDIGAGAASCSGLSIGDNPPPRPAGALPTALELGPNRPNPFNPMTTIQFATPSAGAVRLAVYDLRGRLVVVLVDQVVEAGQHEVRWDGRDTTGRRVASGTYFYAVQNEWRRQIRKLELLK